MNDIPTAVERLVGDILGCITDESTILIHRNNVGMKWRTAAFCITVAQQASQRLAREGQPWRVYYHHDPDGKHFAVIDIDSVKELEVPTDPKEA